MIGHEGVRQVLERQGPVGSMMFVGPPSVGKWTLARHLVQVWGIPDCDVILRHQLSLDTGRQLADLMWIYPPAEGHRVIVVRYDGAPLAARNSLLKMVEDTSDINHFILIGSQLPTHTLSSRCAVYHFSLLSSDEVELILRERHFSDQEAHRLAGSAGGQVRNALDRADNSGLRDVTLQVLHAVATRDAAALDTLAPLWTVEHTSMLGILCREVITQRWGMFSHAEVDGVPVSLALRILTALRFDIRPRLVVRSSLMGVLRGES